MKYSFVLIGAIILLSSCSTKNEDIKINRFIYIQSNKIFIWNPSDLKAYLYLEYFDSLKQIKYSNFNHETSTTKYYAVNVPLKLRNLIIHNLYGKQFPNCFENDPKNPKLDDGPSLTIIYKFSNDKERIIYYLSTSIPDSLKLFAEYLEKLSSISPVTTIDSFDHTSVLNKYRQVISACGPLAPIRIPDSLARRFTKPK